MALPSKPFLDLRSNHILILNELHISCPIIDYVVTQCVPLRLPKKKTGL